MAGHPGQYSIAVNYFPETAALGDPDAMLGLVKQALERGDASGVERWAPVIVAQDETFPDHGAGPGLLGLW
ncbi:hypothetical protein [Streptomyces sp. CLCI03]